VAALAKSCPSAVSTRSAASIQIVVKGSWVFGGDRGKRRYFIEPLFEFYLFNRARSASLSHGALDRGAAGP